VLPITGGDALIYGEPISSEGGLDRVRPLMGVCPQVSARVCVCVYVCERLCDCGLLGSCGLERLKIPPVNNMGGLGLTFKQW
jgi:hypothetical protein